MYENSKTKNVLTGTQGRRPALVDPPPQIAQPTYSASVQ